MTTVLILALIIWGMGATAVVFAALMEYADPSASQTAKRQAARIIVLSPLWPLMALRLGQQVLRDARGEGNRE
ncbi:MAG: hypothetical protein ACTHYO_10355 [Micrococcaceae bacterium]